MFIHEPQPDSAWSFKESGLVPGIVTGVNLSRILLCSPGGVGAPSFFVEHPALCPSLGPAVLLDSVFSDGSGGLLGDCSLLPSSQGLPPQIMFSWSFHQNDHHSSLAGHKQPLLAHLFSHFLAGRELWTLSAKPTLLATT